jgi:hypothetical protein
MAKLTRKLWVGIGVATLAGAAALPDRIAGAQAPGDGGQHKAHGAPAPSGQDAVDTAKRAEGGEAYLTDGGPKDTRVRFYRDIELMRGHLLVGQQLIDLELWDEALPHFLHPSEELYGLMEKYIKLHNMQPFRRELAALVQTVKAKRKGAYQQALGPVHQRIDGALALAKSYMRPQQRFAIQSAIEVLKTAQSEYAASMENGVFVKPVEYQDSRGFVLRAEKVIEAAGPPAPSPVAPGQMAKVRAAFARLKTAWPAPVPPPKPVLEAGEIAALVAEIELYTATAAR